MNGSFGGTFPTVSLTLPLSQKERILIQCYHLDVIPAKAGIQGHFLLGHVSFSGTRQCAPTSYRVDRRVSRRHRWITLR